MSRAKISGVGRALPPRVLTNADLERIVDTSDEWIVERTGIRERRVLADDLAASDLAAEAGRQACEQAGISPEQLDAVIVGTVTGDMPFPAAAVLVQHKIGAGRVPAFDVSAACAGFLFALQIAESFIARGGYEHILVVGVEVLSRVTDWTDRTTSVLFGDGAGAAVVSALPDVTGSEADVAGLILDIELKSDGAQAPHLQIPAGGSREPPSHQTIEERGHFVKMNGRQVFAHAVKNMSAASKAVLDRNGLTADDVTVVCAHQANMRILEGVSQRTGIPLERFFNNIEKYGNTSSASVPIGMSEALEQGRLKRGDLLLLCALGAGLSWGAALVRW